jgi:hypothetical protein
MTTRSGQFSAADFTCAAHLRSQARGRTAASEHASTQARLVGVLSLAASDVPCSPPASGSLNLPGRPHKTSFYNILEASGSNRDGSTRRIEVSQWREDAWAKPGSAWTSQKRTGIRVTLSIGDKETGRSLTATVERRHSPGISNTVGAILDVSEHHICGLIASRVSEVLKQRPVMSNEASLGAIRDAFDEYVVAQHVETHHGLTDLPMSSVFDALHTLSEQSYENKALTFGCILDPNVRVKKQDSRFPRDFLGPGKKKYKALSDGFHTAYHISANGQIIDFVDLERFVTKKLLEKHYYPDWAEPIARASRSRRCGIALSRQGDILIFDQGSLRFTYRYGRWQYWNHAHLVRLLRNRARAQKVRPKVLGRVVGAIYRAALDVSFRRSGGLFVILHNKNKLHSVARTGDAIGDPKRDKEDLAFDSVIRTRSIQFLPRAVAVELASLDGAVVLANSGRVLAYGAVLQPKKAGRLHGTEGSRTKAATGASNYGMAVKISSDGGITVYHEGTAFMQV